MEILDGIDPDALGETPLLPSVRGDLLDRGGRYDEAAAQFDAAAGRTRNDGERALLQRRARDSRAAVTHDR